jgi:hypothetical protein
MITIENFEILSRLNFSTIGISDMYTVIFESQYVVKFEHNSVGYTCVINRFDATYSLSRNNTPGWKIANDLPLDLIWLETPHTFTAVLVLAINNYNYAHN